MFGFEKFIFFYIMFCESIHDPVEQLQDFRSLEREFQPRCVKVFVSLGKILSLNCSIDLSDIR